MSAEEWQTAFEWDWQKRLLVMLSTKRSWLSKAWPSLWVSQCPSCWLLNHPCLYYFIPCPCIPEVISSCGSLSHQGLLSKGNLMPSQNCSGLEESHFLVSLGTTGTPKVWNMVSEGLFLNANHKCMHSLYKWKDATSPYRRYIKEYKRGAVLESDSETVIYAK